ncbi:MAG: hypothetical protein EA367_06050 [Leptolyngbya sp. DLM2.Bin15]|nr:MAG: hypothetical protein EA367_06050 [Leptolyngbya sp. DLM2.Bin15]
MRTNQYLRRLLFLHLGMSGLGLLGAAMLGATPAYASPTISPVFDGLDRDMIDGDGLEQNGLDRNNPIPYDPYHAAQVDERPWAVGVEDDINDESLHNDPLSGGVRVEDLDSAIALDAAPLPVDDEGTIDNLEESVGVEPAMQLEAIAPEGNPMAQVTSVSQLSDVQPTDWAFQALQSLIERYGCIAGYPDGTFRGHQSMSRYEFAAGLNACLEGLARAAISAPDPTVIERLLAEFSDELASLRDRVDTLESRIALLEGQQFSTTTRLFGQLVVGVQGRTDNRADFFPVDGVRDTDDPSTQINLITNAQLSLLTQFNPNSLLLIGMQGGSGSTAPRLTNDTRLSYEGSTDNSLQLSDLTYRQLIGDNFAIVVGPRGVNAVNVFRGANRVESAGFGPLSAFAQRNPVISVGGGDTGLGFDWQVAPWMSVQGVYATSNGPDPARGLFGGDFGDTVLGTQLAFAPTDTLDIALNYVNAYTRSGNLRNSIGDSQVTAASTPLNTNAFGATIAWQATSRFRVGGWAGYTNSQIPGRSGDVETVNWMAFLNIVDLFSSNDLLGLYVGQPPKITSSNLPLGQNLPDRLAGGPGAAGGQPGTTTHVELFYRNRITDNIAITPGFILVFNPGHTPNSETVLIGVLRTTLTF